MSQSHSQIYLHVVFSTKERKPFLQNLACREAMHKCLAKISNDLDCPCLEAGGVEDHVHVLSRLSKTLSASDFIKELKRATSTWVKEEFPDMQSFYWQAGYGAFSVSPSHIGALQGYIRNQPDHHRRESFQDEFRRLLMKYGLAIDERYVWDCTPAEPILGSHWRPVFPRVGRLASANPGLCCTTPAGVGPICRRCRSPIAASATSTDAPQQSSFLRSRQAREHGCSKERPTHIRLLFGRGKRSERTVISGWHHFDPGLHHRRRFHAADQHMATPFSEPMIRRA